MSDWNVEQINQLGRVVTGKTPPKTRADYYEGDELFVSPKDFDWNGGYVEKTQTTISRKALEAFRNQVLPQDAVLFTSLSFGFGKMAIASRRLLTNQQINSVIANDDHHFRFIYYLLRAYTPIIFSYNSGIDTPIVPKSVFEKVQVQCPELKLQRKIAAILTAYDDLIETNKRSIALLEKMAEELYREWFVRMRFPGHQNTKFVKGVPDGWQIRELKECADVNPSSLGRNDQPEVIHYVDIGSVTTNKVGDIQTLPLSEAPGRAKRRVQHGDIIWSSVRPANRAYCLIYQPIENLIVSTGFAVIRPKSETPFTFLKFVVTSNGFVDQMTAVAKGAAYPATSFDDFEKAKLFWPGEDLLAAFHESCEPLFHQNYILNSQNRALTQTRNLLLRRLISGKLSVEDLDIQFPPSMLAEVDSSSEENA